MSDSHDRRIARRPGPFCGNGLGTTRGAATRLRKVPSNYDGHLVADGGTVRSEGVENHGMRRPLTGGTQHVPRAEVFL